MASTARVCAESVAAEVEGVMQVSQTLRSQGATASRFRRPLSAQTYGWRRTLRRGLVTRS
jgi:hypothetical protein